jgi:translation initiation factor 3 subunit D
MISPRNFSNNSSYSQALHNKTSPDTLFWRQFSLSFSEENRSALKCLGTIAEKFSSRRTNHQFVFAPTNMFKLQELQSTDGWGPGDEWELEGALKDVPFAPFSKGDKLGRAADWTAESKDGRDSRSRQGYNRNYRGTLLNGNLTNMLDQYQAYGAGAASSFAYQHGEDEASFSVVDSRSVPKPRTYNRLGAANRGRGGAQRGGRGQLQKLGGRGGARSGQQGGRWGQGFRGRRFGWKDYDKPQRLRDASVQIKPEWKLLEEIEFGRLSKLTLKPLDGEDV